jgi:hypothetical protein
MENKKREEVLKRILKNELISGTTVILTGILFIFLCQLIVDFLVKFITFGG